MDAGGVAEREPHICAGRQSCQRRERPDCIGAQAASETRLESRVKHPCYDPDRYGGENHVKYRLVDLIPPSECIVRAQVEYSVGAQRGRRSIIQVEEPDRAVNQRESHRYQRVHRAHGEPVERELHSLIGGLGYLPEDIERGQNGQRYSQNRALVITVSEQHLAPLGFLASRRSSADG